MFIDLYALVSARGEFWCDPKDILHVGKTSEGIRVGIGQGSEIIRTRNQNAVQLIVQTASSARR